MLECLLVAGRGGGGEEVFLRDLVEAPPPGVRYAVSWGFDDSVQGATVRRLRQTAFNRIVHPFLRPLHGLRSFRVERSFDLIHVHNFLFHAGRRPAAPIVMTVGGGGYPHYLAEYLGWPRGRIERLYRRARALLPPLGITNEISSWARIRSIVVFSRFAADTLVRYGAPGERIVVIPPGFPDRGSAQRGSEAVGARDGDPFVLLFVGRDPHRKGADLVIEAVRRLRSRGIRVLGLMVGDPSFQALEGEEGFEVHPWVPREALFREVYPRADLLALPARAEGFGFVAVEAMGFGIPVLLSDQGAFPEILGATPGASPTGNEGGLLLPAGELEPLVDAVRMLSEDRGALEEMGRAARKRFEDRFTLERHRGELKEVYLQAMQGGGS